MRGRESRAAVFWLAALIVVAAAALWWYWDGAQTEPDTGRPEGAQEVAVHFLQDGDSLEVAALAPGPVIATTDPVQVRLLGIDAPEMHGDDGLPQCGAEAAKARLHELAPAGGRLWLAGDLQVQDNFGRYLAYAWTPDGTFVNARLAEIGAVRELSIYPNFRYRDELAALIEQARSARRGLWGECIS